MTNIRQVQTILFSAMRKAAKCVDQNIEGASLLTIIMAETMAAISTEMASRGSVLRTDGGVEKVVRATVDPLEKMLRENIENLLANEAKATRQ